MGRAVGQRFEESVEGFGMVSVENEIEIRQKKQKTSQVSTKAPVMLSNK